MEIYNSEQKNAKSDSLICCENNEISFVGLTIVLMRRKRIIIVTMLVSLLISIGYLWFVKPIPIYEGSAVVQVGTVGTVGTVVNVENIETLIQRLKIEYPSTDVIKNSATNFVTIKMKANAKVEVEQKLKKITDQLLQKHSVMYNTMLAAQQIGQQKKYDFLNRKIDTVQGQITELEHLIKALKLTEPVQASFLVLQKFKLMDSLQALKKNVFNFNLSISKSKSRPSKIIGKITVKDISVKSKVEKIILFGVIFGFMLGIISAFITEFIATVRQKMVVTEK